MLREVVELEPWVKIVWLPTNQLIADGLTKCIWLMGLCRRVANNVQSLHSQVLVCLREWVYAPRSSGPGASPGAGLLVLHPTDRRENVTLLVSLSSVFDLLWRCPFKALSLHMLLRLAD